MKALFLAPLCSISLGFPAQQPKPTAGTPRFAVAVIKPSQSWDGKMAMHDGTLQITDLYLKSVITNAYGVREDLIYGLPSWAQTVRYDITAKMNPDEASQMNNLTRSERREMVAALLAERFNLKVHTEIKVRPVYELVLVGDAPKFPIHAQETAASIGPANRTGTDSVKTGAGQFEAKDVTLSLLTAFLEENLEANIIDKTGLQGRYDLRLRWTPDIGSPSSSDGDAPSLFTALADQLGLKLRPSRGPVETLVVDRIDQPSAN